LKNIPKEKLFLNPKFPRAHRSQSGEIELNFKQFPHFNKGRLVLGQFGFVGLLEFKAKLCLSFNKAQRRTPTTRQSYLDKVFGIFDSEKLINV
jgi:hypothetical protein